MYIYLFHNDALLIFITVGVLLWQCSLHSMLFSMSIVQKFNVNQNHVCGDAAVKHHRRLRHAHSDYSGRTHQGLTFLKPQFSYLVCLYYCRK